MTLCIGNLKFGEMEFGEMKQNTSNWSNFCVLPRRAGLSASAGLSCKHFYNAFSVSWRTQSRTVMENVEWTEFCGGERER